MIEKKLYLKLIKLLPVLFIIMCSCNHAPAKLSFDHPSIDVGKVKAGTTNIFTIKIRNTGDEELIIKEAKAECGCTNIDIPKKTLLGNETGVVKISFTAFTVYPPNYKFKKSIVFLSNGADKINDLTISGIIVK